MFSKLLKVVMITLSPLSRQALVRLSFKVFSGGEYVPSSRQSSSPNVGVQQWISLATLERFCKMLAAH